jgi:hypothetical protein
MSPERNNPSGLAGANAAKNLSSARFIFYHEWSYGPHGRRVRRCKLRHHILHQSIDNLGPTKFVEIEQTPLN